MNVDVLERNLSRQMRRHHHHTRDPEENNIEASD